MTTSRLLVANRGEIACRIIRSAHDLGIATVAVFSDPDATAPHVDLADEAVHLPGATPGQTYLDIGVLVEAATRAGADAVHPGYGFLAETAAFARACADAGLVFVGPPAEAIAAMGDKLAAKDIMHRAGVPTLAWRALSSEDDPVAAVAEAEIAYPVIVKAAAGGGGKGMRVVGDAAALEEAVAAARREAARAFADDRVFVEPFVERPRHVEVQVLGDHHGSVVHLGERECSIQRRHQKVIEEAPSPAVDEELRRRLCAAAVDAARAIGYTNAGTVEFVLAPDRTFAFLEVNTRLQVEHAVTELAWALADGTALDLVALQLRIAGGEPLPFTQDEVVLRRHAIEARLYAEDPSTGFLPSTGVVRIWDPHRAEGVRWDEGVRRGTTVGAHYDPLLAKVIATGETRAQAAGRLARALERTRVHGVRTNRGFLAATLRHPAFLSGDLHTAFIEEHAPAPDAPDPAPFAVAAALAAARRRHTEARVLGTVPPGWRNNQGEPQRVAYDHAGHAIEVGYRRGRDGAWLVEVDDAPHPVEVHAWPDERPDDAIDLSVGGVRRRYLVTPGDEDVHVSAPPHQVTLAEVPRFPVPTDEAVAGAMTAPMPGTVVAIPVEPGSRVLAGDLLAVIEAMKMEHRVLAPHEGTVTDVPVTEGAVVETGTVLVVLSDAE